MPDFSHQPTLTGDLVVLRPVTEADVPALLPVFEDPEVTRLTGNHTHFRRGDAREAVRLPGGDGQPAFHPEGVLRGALLWEGERVDATVMSALAPEWTSGASVGP
ncbi:hypothetical protein AB0F16_04940 [Streptomyces tanashiensis]|uniref:GNAT family N-acetyltransferase n=1 Tax=Streptomyces tanashiensis TaxID=67367 RepID=UPI0033E1FEAA